MSSKRTELLMIEGPIWKHIVSFSMPLAVGYLFQQFYTTVDSIVVGKYVGKEALAAIGTTTPILNTMIGFFTGLSVGAGVIVSKYYGAQNREKVEKAVNSFVLLIMIMSIFATFIGIIALPVMMKIMAIPEDVWESAYEYLFIYFCGISTLILYNSGSAILRAVGDSTRPLIYLVVSSVVNVVFDIIMVVLMDMGVKGAAYATVLSEIVSVILVLYSLTTTDGMYGIHWKKMKIDWAIIKEIMMIGIPNAIQQSLTFFSNVFVQSYINYFGSSVMAGWSAYLKIDQVIAIPINSIAMALTTFTGQNLGAGKLDRAKKGTKISVCIVFVSTALIFVTIESMPALLISLFNSDSDVIENGVYFIRNMTPFYFFWAICMVLEGALCGAGVAKITTGVKFSSYVILRQCYLFVVRRLKNELSLIAFGYPLGWIVAGVIITIYYLARFDKIILKFSDISC